MIDKRIIKTKKSLKNALMELVRKKAFEKITVTEICDTASTGRVTFYTYYNDKYDLLKECFADAREEIQHDFEQRQAKSGSAANAKEGFLNLLDAILDTVQKYADAGMHLLSSPDMLFMYYQFIIDNIESFELKFDEDIQSEFDRDRMNAFFALGVYGFIHAKESTDWQALKDEAHRFVSPLVDSMVLP